MTVLDIDLDYFLDCPVYERCATDGRVTCIECIESVWSEERVRAFIENNLGLSKEKRIKGRIFEGHDEALCFWDELLEKKELIAPFLVVHVDSHPDLGCLCMGNSFVFEELIYYPLEYRKPYYCKRNEYGNYPYNEGNYLLYAVAFRWISRIVYLANPNCKYNLIPQEILNKEISENLLETEKFIIQLEPRISENTPMNNTPNEPLIPLCIVPTVEEIKCSGNFDFISIAKSPNFTPSEADFILDIFREYIDKI